MTKMTREEAIKQIESLFEHCEAMMTSDEPVWSQDCEALKVALSALRGPTREHVKMMKTSVTDVDDDDPLCDYGHCAACGAYIVADNFCSVCGVPFTDQAVETIMKRLEEVRK